MANRITEADLQNIMDFLRGSCGTLAQACQAYDYEEEDLTAEQLDEIKQEMFVCTSCGWWHEQHESSEHSPDGENYCIECGDEENDEEDEDEY